MFVGVPREIKTNENRVALVPFGVEAIAADDYRSGSRWALDKIVVPLTRHTSRLV